MHIPYENPTALVSVSAKEGISEFASVLQGEFGWNLHSSGGTCKHLRQAGLEVTDVADIIGMRAILGHKVVTLHPKVHGGLLADDSEDDLADMEEFGIERYDMVVVDLYDLLGQWGEDDRTLASIRHNTDIGGPTMLRSGAKGGRIVVSSASQRSLVLDWIRAGCPDMEQFALWLAIQAEQLIRDYCDNSALLLTEQLGEWRLTGQIWANNWIYGTGLGLRTYNPPVASEAPELTHAETEPEVQLFDPDEVG